MLPESSDVAGNIDDPSGGVADVVGVLLDANMIMPSSSIATRLPAPTNSGEVITRRSGMAFITARAHLGTQLIEQAEPVTHRHLLGRMTYIEAI
jgi:hypothetical protein